MNSSHNSATRPMVAIPRHPMAEDTQAIVEFLAQEHPQLYEALRIVEQVYQTFGLDLSPENRKPEESEGA